MKILKFNAVWCPSCLVMKKNWKEIESETKTYEIIDFDYDFDEDEVKKYNVGDKLPVAILTDDEGNEIRRIVGEKNSKELLQFIRG